MSSKARSETRFDLKRVRDIKTNRPFVVPNMGYFVWVVPPIIDGAENDGKRRVLCYLKTERNGTSCVCAVAVGDKHLEKDLGWQKAVELHDIKHAFGTSTNKPEVYICHVRNDEVLNGGPARFTRLRYRLTEDATKDAPGQG